MNRILEFVEKNRKLLFILVGFFYFTIRLIYWFQTKEDPFSDTADYVRIAVGIIERGDFSHSANFWYSYKPPSMPLILALYFKIRGSYALDFWPFFQTIFNFFALVYLVKQISRILPNPTLSLSILAVFALSTSSVFWSLKPATEYCSETVLIFLCAFVIDAYQRTTVWQYWLLGFFAMGAVLLKPQFMPILLILPCAQFLYRGPWRRNLIKVLLLGAGIFTAWLPWGVRTYQIYGTPILTSTQGPYTFLWDLGKVEYADNEGKIVTTDINELQTQAPQKFRNDFEAMSYANKVAKYWLHGHYLEYIKIIPERVVNTMIDGFEGLTKVPRNELFPPWADWILLDKFLVLIVGGVFGLISILFYQPKLWSLCLMPISFWLMGIAFLGYPRVLDPALPAIYIGNLFLIINAYEFLRRRA